MLVIESLRLARLAFFEPFKLDEELRGTGPYLATGVSIWQVRSGLNPQERRVVFQALAAIAVGAIAWPLIGRLMARPSELPWWFNVVVALTSLLFGIAGLLIAGISFGVTMGVSVSLAGSLAAMIGPDPILTLADAQPIDQVIGAVVLGCVSGLVLGLILGLAAMATFIARPAFRWFGGVCSASGGAAFGVFLALATDKHADGIAGAVCFILTVFFCLSFMAGYFLGHRRLPLYLVELIGQIVLTGFSSLATKTHRTRWLVRRLYQFSPATWDELIWLPLWTLDRQLTWLALVGDRPFALQAIGKIARSLHQAWAAEAALATILAHDLRDCRRIPEIAKANVRLDWFPRAVDLPTLALRRTVILLNEVSQNAEAATRALDSPGWRINLGKAQTNLDALQKMLARMDQRAAGPLDEVVQCWKRAIEQALESAPQDAGPVLIENFYIAGNPIPPDKERVFVGREDLFAQLQENLAATQKPTLVLHGQRRTGKTSLLLQLPNRLSADYVPVYVDLQQTAPVDGLNRFLYTLAREAVRQADEKRRIALPPAEMDDFDRRGHHAFYEWLALTQEQLSDRLLFFTLDEFEKIEEAIERERLDEAVLDVLRHLIQHYSDWLVLLFAGVRTLEEMSRNWHSYFISVRPIHVSYLDPKAARRLILLPTETYPIHYDRRAVEAILEATHAQPFLIQAVCFELIQYLNSKNRRLAGPFGRVTVADARNALRLAVRSATPYFHDLWATCNDLGQLVLAELAYSQEGWVRVDSLSKDLDMDSGAVHQALEQIKRRELIERGEHVCRFQVPMMRQWIREEKSLEAVRLASQPLSKGARRRDQE